MMPRKKTRLMVMRAGLQVHVGKLEHTDFGRSEAVAVGDGKDGAVALAGVVGEEDLLSPGAVTEVLGSLFHVPVGEGDGAPGTIWVLHREEGLGFASAFCPPEAALEHSAAGGVAYLVVVQPAAGPAVVAPGDGDTPIWSVPILHLSRCWKQNMMASAVIFEGRSESCVGSHSSYFSLKVKRESYQQ